jgi:MoaA/NifB/PqqE/SkfB family radical SAM enzyme
MTNKTNLLDKEKTQKENRIWVRIASSCNNKCVFCLDSDAHNWTFVDNDVVKKQIKEWFKEWYINRVIISWWEASIDPKFSEYIKYAKDIGYDRVQTVTNWNMFAIESFCKKVFDAWLEEVTFSFHGHNAKLHDYLVDTKWAFMKSLKWLIYIKKYYPNIIINIDIVVNKINVDYLPDIVKFFMKLWVYEYDVLQIIPFWRWFSEYKDKLFYNISEHKDKLTETWKLSKINWMYMWTNRFPAEAFEWYEDLIQDPRKIKSEVMWEWIAMFKKFIESKWINKTECYWEACNVCFLNQYCHGFLSSIDEPKLNFKDKEKFYTLKWEEFPSSIYKKYWENKELFFEYLNNKIKDWYKLINVPKCLWWEWIYEKFNDTNLDYELWNYTKEYINNLYRKKSLRCIDCKHNNECDWIHINFIRSYWFNILKTK